MRYLRILAVLSVCLVSASFAHAQRFSVGIGVEPAYVEPGYIGPPPVCTYGYYDYYPYACAPYGYYGPSWFSGGIFIGAGPWFRGGFYGRPGFYERGYWGHPRFRGDFDGRGGHRFIERGPVGGFHGDSNFHGGNSFHGGGGGFHGGGNFHGGRGFHGGGGHGGGRR